LAGSLFVAVALDTLNPPFAALYIAASKESTDDAEQALECARLRIRTKSCLLCGSGFRVQGLGFGVWGLGFMREAAHPHIVLSVVRFRVLSFEFRGHSAKRLVALIYEPVYESVTKRVVAIPATPSDLLNIGLNGRWAVVVYNSPHIGLVDAHTEGNRCYHGTDFVVDKVPLDSASLLVSHS
jgi:hypothetical protein